MSIGPLADWEALVARGRLIADPAQARAAQRLQALHDVLVLATAPVRPARASRWARWLPRASTPATLVAPKGATARGVYLHGDVGRGKSMLMDLFFAAAPLAAKRRTHFHSFMIEVHDALQRHRDAASPLLATAAALAREVRLLCFDELQVTDIADAMILERLFRAMLDRGVTMVITSNSAPEALYPDGLRRENFLPCIALIRECLDIVVLESPTDYRGLNAATLRAWIVAPAATAQRLLARAFRRRSGGAMAAADVLTVRGRTLRFDRSGGGVLWTGFQQLCGAALGAEDYLRLAARYHTLLLEGVPLLDEALRNETKRFITLVDAMYESRLLLIVSAAAPLQGIHRGHSQAFAFRRAASRLREMQTQGYQSVPAAPSPAAPLAASAADLEPRP